MHPLINISYFSKNIRRVYVYTAKLVTPTQLIHRFYSSLLFVLMKYRDTTSLLHDKVKMWKGWYWWYSFSCITYLQILASRLGYHQIR